MRMKNSKIQCFRKSALIMGVLAFLPMAPSAQAGWWDDLKDVVYRPIENRSGDELIQQFGSACDSKGTWTTKALAQTSQLHAVLDSLKDKVACKPFETQLTRIKGLSTDVGNYLQDKQFQKYLGLKSQLSDVASVLNGMPSGNGTEFDEVRSRAFLGVFEKQYQLVDQSLASSTAQRDLDSNASYRSRAVDMVDTVQSMLSDMSALQECLVQSPRAALQIAVQMMAVSEQSQTPEEHLAVSGIAQLMEIAISFMGDAQVIERSKFKSDKTKMVPGLICALEAMTEVYCKAQDSREQFKFQSEAYKIMQNGKASVEPIWRGMHILTRELPSIAKFLWEVRFGGPLTDDDDADRQNKVWGKSVSLDNTYRSVSASLYKFKMLYDKVPKGGVDTSDQQRAFLNNALKQTAGRLSSDQSYAMMMGSEPRVMACRLTLDPIGKNCGIMGEIGDLDNYIMKNDLLSQTTFEELMANFERISAIARDVVAQEFAQFVTIDPARLLVGAFEPSADRVAPFEAFQDIDAFLKSLGEMVEEHPGVIENPLLIDMIGDTRAMIRDVLGEILNLKRGLQSTPSQVVMPALRANSPAIDPLDEALHKIKIGTSTSTLSQDKLSKEIGYSSDEQYRKIVAKIFLRFQLRLGIQFVTDRVKFFVEADLQRRLRMGQFPRDTAGILIALGGSISEQLLTQPANLDTIKRDIDLGQTVAYRNLQNFLNYYRGNITSDPIQDAADALYKNAKESRTGLYGPMGQTLAHLCLLALTAYGPDNEKNFPLVGRVTPHSGGAFIEACEDTVLVSGYAERAGFSNPALGNLMLGAKYMDLWRLYSGDMDETYLKNDPLNKRPEGWTRTNGNSVTAELSDMATTEMPSDVENPELARESAHARHSALIFKQAIATKRDARDRSFDRKVCTYHRFIRAGRVMEALPALDTAHMDILEAQRILGKDYTEKVQNEKASEIKSILGTDILNAE